MSDFERTLLEHDLQDKTTESHVSANFSDCLTFEELDLLFNEDRASELESKRKAPLNDFQESQRWFLVAQYREKKVESRISDLKGGEAFDHLGEFDESDEETKKPATANSDDDDCEFDTDQNYVHLVLDDKDKTEYLDAYGELLERTCSNNYEINEKRDEFLKSLAEVDHEVEVIRDLEDLEDLEKICDIELATLKEAVDAHEKAQKLSTLSVLSQSGPEYAQWKQITSINQKIESLRQKVTLTTGEAQNSPQSVAKTAVNTLLSELTQKLNEIKGNLTTVEREQKLGEFITEAVKKTQKILPEMKAEPSLFQFVLEFLARIRGIGCLIDFVHERKTGHSIFSTIQARSLLNEVSETFAKPEANPDLSSTPSQLK